MKKEKLKRAINNIFCFIGFHNFELKSEQIIRLSERNIDAGFKMGVFKTKTVKRWYTCKNCSCEMFEEFLDW